MTKYLSRVLGIADYDFAQRVRSLEHASLQTGMDIRITTSIRAGVHQKMQALGLDPHDTTGDELFHALRQVAQQGDTELRSKLKTASNASSVEILKSVTDGLSASISKQSVWAIKRSALKKILTVAPPLKVMKTLHYRSATSMLKREKANELYALACILEGSQYQEKVKGALKKLAPADFEELPLEIIYFSEKRWDIIKKYIKKQTVPVFSLPEVASIVVLPVSTDKVKCLALLSSALILCETKRIKEHATYLKLKTLDPQLHVHVRTLAEHGRIPMFTLHGEQIYWHHIHHVVGKRDMVPEEFHPHMSKQDLEWLNTEAQLAALVPSLSFWVETHRLAFVSDAHVVSFHLLDVAFAAMYDIPVDQVQNIFVKESVADELYESYLSIPPFDKIVDGHMYKLTDIDTEILYDEA